MPYNWLSFRRDQRLCQLEVSLMAGLTMLDRFWLRDQTKFSTPLMLAPSVQVDIVSDLIVGHFSQSPDWMSYDPVTRMPPVVACIICHTLTDCSVARSPKLVVLAVKSVVRPTYCNSDARYPGMEVTRPATWQDKVSKVWPPSSLFNHFRLTGPYSQSLYWATPPPGVVEKCVPVGS